MTRFNCNHKFTAAAAIGAAALFSMISFGSNAEAAQSVSRCQGGTEKAVVSCCNMLTKAQRPFWMIQTHSSCQEVVVCAGKKNSDRRCYVRVTYNENDGGDGDDGGEDGGGNPGGDPNTPR